MLSRRPDPSQDRIERRGPHLRTVGFPRKPHAGGKIRRSDERPVHPRHRQDRFQIVQCGNRLDLHDGGRSPPVPARHYSPAPARSGTARVSPATPGTNAARARSPLPPPPPAPPAHRAHMGTISDCAPRSSSFLISRGIEGARAARPPASDRAHTACKCDSTDSRVHRRMLAVEQQPVVPAARRHLCHRACRRWRTNSPAAASPSRRAALERVPGQGHLGLQRGRGGHASRNKVAPPRSARARRPSGPCPWHSAAARRERQSRFGCLNRASAASAAIQFGLLGCSAGFGHGTPPRTA